MDKETPAWTIVQRCLDATATEDEYAALDRDYIRIEDDCVRVCGPRKGPYTLPKTEAVMSRVAAYMITPGGAGGIVPPTPKRRKNHEQQRACKCGKPLPKRRRLCDSCKAKNRRDTNRRNTRKYRGRCHTVNENSP